MTWNEARWHFCLLWLTLTRDAGLSNSSNFHSVVLIREGVWDLPSMWGLRNGARVGVSPSSQGAWGGQVCGWRPLAKCMWLFISGFSTFLETMRVFGEGTSFLVPKESKRRDLDLSWILANPEENTGGRSCCGEGNGTPLQNSCLENPMDRGAW